VEASTVVVKVQVHASVDSGTLVIAASIIAAVRLAREEDISERSPRLMAAVANSVQLAKNILDTVRKRFPGEE
jgi:hypothetical protein